MANMTAVEYVQGLRDFADWVEENTESLDGALHFDRHIGEASIHGHTPERFAELVKTLGRGVKKPDEKWMNVRREFGPITAEVWTSRENVCRKIVKGTRSVTSKVLDPELVKDIPLVDVTSEEEIVEWVCDEPILANLPDAEQVPA